MKNFKKINKTIEGKIVLVGESGVGKTCIIQRYINNTFENQNSSLAATFLNKEIEVGPINNKKLVSLNIWDTVGQEKFRTMTRNFYRNASVGVMVYDITKRETFEEVKEYWYKQLKEESDKNAFFVIVGNKCDLYEYQTVTKNEGAEFAKEIGALFYLTSSVTGKGINDMFIKIAEKLCGIDGEDFQIIEYNKNKDSVKIEEIIKNYDNNKEKKRCCK